jgi:hypothetical protein
MSGFGGRHEALGLQTSKNSSIDEIVFRYNREAAVHKNAVYGSLKGSIHELDG